MHYLDLRVCDVTKGTVTLVRMAYSGVITAGFGNLGPYFRRFFWVKTTVLDYYVTKKTVI